jgi:hypothetical protein
MKHSAACLSFANQLLSEFLPGCGEHIAFTGNGLYEI